MLIFNTTYCVTKRKYELFVEWLRETYIPAVTKDGVMKEPVLSKVLGQTELGDSGESVSLQLRVADPETLEAWKAEEAEKYQKEMARKFGQEVLYFNSVMEII